MELKDTIELMQSDDYRDRFKAEYYQEFIRFTKLEDMIVKYQAGTLDFEPTCPLELLKDQVKSMRQKLFILKVRAEREGIKL